MCTFAGSLNQFNNPVVESNETQHISTNQSVFDGNGKKRRVSKYTEKIHSGVNLDFESLVPPLNINVNIDEVVHQHKNINRTG